MNNRDYKQFSAGEYYHLYNRGTGKANIFADEQDYYVLRNRLYEYLNPAMGTIASARRKTFPKDSFSVICYCLMPNHFHFLIRQNTDLPISALMLNLWSGYSKYFNRRYERVGSLFQDQFKSILVDNDTYLKWLSAYIHQNPTVARMVDAPQRYSHSSYREYIDSNQRNICETKTILDQFQNTEHYRDFVEESLELMRERKDLEHLLID